MHIQAVDNSDMQEDAVKLNQTQCTHIFNIQKLCKFRSSLAGRRKSHMAEQNLIPQEFLTLDRVRALPTCQQRPELERRPTGLHTFMGRTTDGLTFSAVLVALLALFRRCCTTAGAVACGKSAAAPRAEGSSIQQAAQAAGRRVARLELVGAGGRVARKQRSVREHGLAVLVAVPAAWRELC